MTKKKKLATLTMIEDRYWVNYFEFYTNEGLTDTKAGQRAWKALQDDFPRLKKYDGCKP